MLLSPARIKHGFLRLIPNSVKKKVKDIVYSKEEVEKNRLRSLPRYVETETMLLGKKTKLLDAASFLFLMEEIFENHIYKFEARRDNPYIIDGGANIGASVIYFKKLYPKAKILAFEPDPKVFEVLKTNLAEFGFSDVEVVPKGLWNSDTTLKFLSEGADAGRIPGESGDENTISIKTARLSSFLTQPVDFLKLDIEGAEYEVLKECREQLERVDKIFVEYHSFVGQEQFLPEILEILKTAGFRLYVSTPGLYSPNPFVTVRSYLGMDLQVNIFGLRTN